MQKLNILLTIFVLTLFLCFIEISIAKKLMKTQTKEIPASFNRVSNNLIYVSPSSNEKRHFIEAGIKCPDDEGGLQGFGITPVSTYANRSGQKYDVFAFKYECAKNDADILDKTSPLINGKQSVGTKVDVCKTDGSQGHFMYPVGNTCECPDGYVIKTLEFSALKTLKNYIGVKCQCAKIKSDIKLKCSNKQTLRMSTDNVTNQYNNLLYNYIKSIPVLTNAIASLKSVTFSLTFKDDKIDPSYSANAVFLDYTFCYNTSIGPISNPPNNIDTVGVIDLDIWIIAYYHNLYRNQIATQTTKFGNQLPLAKYMRQIYWNKEIASLAQKHANNCVFEHSSAAFRNSPKFGQLGENIGIISSVSGPIKNWAKIVTMWNDEIRDFVKMKADVENFQDSTTATFSHFTQLVWADSFLIGCGYSVYIENGMTKTLYVCMYGPAGNILGKPIYKKVSSPTDKSCPAGTTASSKDYPGLCCIDKMCTKNEYYFNN